jgi:hypothetical protein
MSKRTVGVVLVALGVELIVVSLFADTLGIGCNMAVFGWKQILGTVVGAVVTLGGVLLALLKPSQKK